MTVKPEEIPLDPNRISPDWSQTDYSENMGDSAGIHHNYGLSQNLTLLSLLLIFSLLANLAAFPIILFRRTRFGNGQFAVLILCLTISDLLIILCGILGALILEAGGMYWGGSGSGCAVYYFFTSWLLGLSNYLIVCLVCMILVKRSSGILARLQECRLLLLSLVFLTLLPAIPELAIRSTFSDPVMNVQLCIISTRDGLYALYVILKFSVRHTLPLVLVILCILRPRTRLAKRLSFILVGDGVTCECGPSGTELLRPHECPKISSLSCRPDLVRDTDSKNSSIPIMLEDPVRRRYKIVLAVTFTVTTSLYLLVDSVFHIQSAVTESWLAHAEAVSVEEMEGSHHEANLATALHFFTFIQQIISPLIFVYSEFFVK